MLSSSLTLAILPSFRLARLFLLMGLALGPPSLVFGQYAEDEEKGGGSYPQEERSLPSRAPWTQSRVMGSPEPADLYSLKRVWPHVTMPSALEIRLSPDAKRLFVLDQGGKLVSFDALNPESTAEPCAEFKNIVRPFTASYGFAFDPAFEVNRAIYLCYVSENGNDEGTRVSRFRMKEGVPPTIDASSEEILISWYGGGHNGGCLRFGPDGCLYISAGDGGNAAPPDEKNTGQNISDLLGSILRIDVRTKSPGLAYQIPADNPFLGIVDARPEIWAFGLRNPWRFCFDARSGELWAGDVGWELWEMVHRIERGGNYGWPIQEGRQQVRPNEPPGPGPLLAPVAEHAHSEARSITGGEVYHGHCFPELQGAYVYGDYETGKVWALRTQDGVITWKRELCDTQVKITAFCHNAEGEILVLDYDHGAIYQLVKNDDLQQNTSFPQRLSETGLFSDVADQTPSPGVLAYRVNAAPWRDGAVAERWIAVPGNERVRVAEGFQFPINTVFAQTLRDADGSLLETRMLHNSGQAWMPYTFRWLHDGSDAVLVSKEGGHGASSREPVGSGAIPNANSINSEFPLSHVPAEEKKGLEWRYMSRAECGVCHNFFAGQVLGFTREQLSGSSGGSSELQRLYEAGLFDALPGNSEAPLVDPRASGTDLHARARSYLHVNCAHCHRNGGGGSAKIELLFSHANDQLQAIDAPCQLGAFGLKDARIVSAGKPFQSALFYRVSTQGAGHMPLLGSRTIDFEGVRLIHDWITSLPSAASPLSQAAETAKARDNSTTRMQLNLQRLHDPSAERSLLASAIEETLADTSACLALVTQWRDHPLPPANFDLLCKTAAESSHLPSYGLLEPFLPKNLQVKKLGDDVQPQSLLALKGVAERGKDLFFAEGALQCLTCHRVGDKGGKLGPELTHIGAQQKPEEILASLLNPSEKIDERFRTYVVETTEGDVLVGVIQRGPDGLTMVNEQGATLTISHGSVERITGQARSLMPDKLLRNLTAQQAADLLAFLASLK